MDSEIIFWTYLVAIGFSVAGFLAPFYELLLDRARAVQEFDPIRQALSFATSAAWMHYAFVSPRGHAFRDLSIAGCTLILIFTACCTPPPRRVTTLLTFLTITLGVLVSSFFISAFFIGEEELASVLSWFCTTCTLVAYTPTIYDTVRSFQDGSAGSMTYLSPCILLAASLTWALYGVFTDATYVMAANFIGLVIGESQLVLIRAFRAN